MEVIELCPPAILPAFPIHSAFMDLNVFAGNQVLPQVTKNFCHKKKLKKLKKI